MACFASRLPLAAQSSAGSYLKPGTMPPSDFSQSDASSLRGDALSKVIRRVTWLLSEIGFCFGFVLVCFGFVLVLAVVFAMDADFMTCTLMLSKA